MRYEDPTQSGFNQLWLALQLCAKRRGISWSLDKDEFRELTKGNCAYCGKEPQQIKKNYGSQYLYNGIDRVDNSLGYVPSNCVSCCKICNKMKNTFTKEEFINQIKRIYLHLQGNV